MRARQRFALPAVGPGQRIDDATVWTGRDYPDDRRWVRRLDDGMRDEILRAMRGARSRGVEPARITEADFPLQRTLPLLAEVYRDLECGPGFAMLADFPLEGLSEADVTLAYCGLCAHLGSITLQNREGETILEVTDKGKGYDRRSRGYHSTAHLDFHNDGTNTVTLLCLETAAEGGESRLVSGPAVYNEILAARPELLDAFHRGFHHHRRDQRAPGEPPVTPYRTPVFGFRDGLFHLAYTGPSIRFCVDEGVEITSHERSALEYLESVLARPEMPVTMALRRGDLQLVNNFLVLHSRTAYRDAPGRRRRLLRLWLDDEESARLGPGKMDWYLPEQSRFTRIGGIATLEH